MSQLSRTILHNQPLSASGKTQSNELPQLRQKRVSITTSDVIIEVLSEKIDVYVDPEQNPTEPGNNTQ
ncbi:MAG: hypothetical protein ACMG6E_04635 [Candidatus Roizmanbacteria bacterium]